MSAVEAVRHVAGSAFVGDRPKHLGVAVSGGGDSMALLDAMRHHGAELGFPVSSVTVDHGLRSEAKDEAAAVAAFCEARGIAHTTLRWTWGQTGNLQAAARDARYRLMAEWARETGVDWIALGHTRDDQAETFLMRLSRQAGLDGLAEMERRFERHGTRWIRPLLSMGRNDLRDYLRALDITWSEDPSNEDLRYERVRARAVLAALEPLGIAAGTLSLTSHHLAMARSALRHYARQEARNIVSAEAGDVLFADKPIHPETHRRLLVAVLQYVAGAKYAPRDEALVELQAALDEGTTRTLHGCLLTKEADRTIRITREWAAVKHEVTPTGAIWDHRWQLDGPHAAGLEIRALGEAGLAHCPDWRATGLPRSSLLATPAIWKDDTVIAAPLAGLANGWAATLRPSFAEFMDIH